MHTTTTPATEDTKPRRSARILNENNIEKSKVNESQEESETAGLGALKLVRSAPLTWKGKVLIVDVAKGTKASTNGLATR